MIKPIHIKVTFFLAVMMLAATNTYSQADTTNQQVYENMTLEELLNVKITTVSKSSQNAGDAPASVIVINSQQLRSRGYLNLADVLNDLPDVKLNDKSDPQYFNSFNIRGINGPDRFVILLDGIKISSPTNDPLPILENYPIYLAKQIEVVFGPGSALYGADAMAGVINIITDQEDDRDLLQATVMGGMYGYSNQNLFLKKKLKNGFNLSAGGQYTYDKQADFSKIYPNEYPMTGQQTGIFNTAYGPMNPTQSLDPDYSAPVKTHNIYLALEQKGFDFKILHHYAQIPSSTTLKPNNAVYNKDVFYGQGVTTANISFADSIGILKSVTSLQGSSYSVNPGSNYRNLYGAMAHGYKYGNGSMIKLDEQLSTAVTKDIQVTGGVTYELFKSIPKSVELSSPQIKGNAVEGTLLNSTDVFNPEGIPAKFYPLTYTNIGSFLQGQFTPLNKLAVTLGMRYDHNSRFGSTVNPRIGVVYNQSVNTIIKALYGTAYWAPSPQISYEQYGSFYSEDGGRNYKSDFWHLPNPDLKPSTSETAEFSVSQKFKSSLNITLTAYYTKVYDLITNVADNGNTNLYNNRYLGYPVSYIEVPVNTGTQKTYGGNLNVNSIFNIGQSKFNIWSSISYVDGTVNQFGNFARGTKVHLPFIAPWQFRAGVDGRSQNFNYSVRLLRSGKQRVTGFTNPDNPHERQLLEGYTLVNASAGYTWNKFTLFTRVSNALDKRYRHPITVNLEDNNSVTFHGALQDPLRVVAGLALRFE